MDKPAELGSQSIQQTYSKSALQILSAYHSWRQRSAGEHTASPAPRESELLGKSADQIWELALELSGDEYFGLHAGAALVQHSNGHFLTTLAANSTTVAKALENFCNYHELCSHAPHPVLQQRGQSTVITLTDVDGNADKPVFRQMCECLFSAIVTILAVLCRQAIIPSAVHFRWPAPANGVIYEAVFKRPVTFGSSSISLEFANDALDTPIPYADEQLLSTLTRYADRQLHAIAEAETWSSKVKSMVCHSALAMDLDISSVSANLGISPRRLQQRLKSETTSFQAIMREIKADIAKHYLANRSMPLAEIALLLGYSEQSAFNHAFKSWTGETPKQFQKSCASLDRHRH